ncbi:melanopsin-A-like [Sinocyclocheilus anshuiensis]|uniref:melanopsin-A-like n=1 Tax=Sinocyclocheilus anshuiensis TaxID=1608454 RepID=UPI0007B8DF01|nr:PREDICTED: melanopsin-A-like [Sinocyclocheilus anshuiensis]
MSTRRSTLTSQSSEASSHLHRAGKTRLSSVSDSESGWTDTEADLSSTSSRPASRQVSSDIRKDLSDFKHSSSLRLKVKSRDSGIFDRTSAQSLAEPNLSRTCTYISPNIVSENDEKRQLARIPSIIVTSESSPSRQLPGASVDAASVTVEPAGID